MIRIVGLSATLPNFLDVARFLGVSPFEGLFVFDGRFRPVPLGQTFIGVKGTSTYQVANEMDKVCYDKVLDNVEKGYQVRYHFIATVKIRFFGVLTLLPVIQAVHTGLIGTRKMEVKQIPLKGAIQDNIPGKQKIILGLLLFSPQPCLELLCA